MSHAYIHAHSAQTVRTESASAHARSHTQTHTHYIKRDDLISCSTLSSFSSFPASRS